MLKLINKLAHKGLFVDVWRCFRFCLCPFNLGGVTTSQPWHTATTSVRSPKQERCVCSLPSISTSLPTRRLNARPFQIPCFFFHLREKMTILYIFSTGFDGNLLVLSEILPWKKVIFNYFFFSFGEEEMQERRNTDTCKLGHQFLLLVISFSQTSSSTNHGSSPGSY